MFRSEQIQTVVVDYDINTAYDAIVKGVATLKDFTIKSADKDTHSICIDVGLSLWSYGEQITVSFNNTSDTKTEVKFVSCSKLGAEITAKSKNRQNIDALIDAMNKQLQ